MNPSQIPDGWHLKKLEETGEAIIGLTYSPKDVVDSGGIEVLRSSNVKNGRIVLDDLVRVNANIPEKIILQKGDILICARNGSRKLIGKNARIDELNVGKTFGAFMCVYRSTNPDFMFWLFQTQSFKKQIARDLGPTINQVTSGNLNSFKFAFPETEEQKRITSVLQLWDDYLKLLDAKIEAKQNIKIALMQQLLTGKIRLPGYTQPWDKTHIKSFARVDSGYGFPEAIQGVKTSAIPFIKVSDMNLPGNEEMINSWNNTISHEEMKDLRAKTFPAGSIIFPKIGAAINTNKKRLLSRPTIVDNNVMVIIPTDLKQSYFIYQWLKMFDISRWANDAGVPSMRKSEVENHLVYAPTNNDEIIAISEILRKADNELEVLLKLRSVVYEQHNYLINNLTDGRIRTPDDLCIANKETQYA